MIDYFRHAPKDEQQRPITVKVVPEPKSRMEVFKEKNGTQKDEK
jgi:hypothetical protein